MSQTAKPVPLLLCRVCGLEQKIPPWGAGGTKPSFSICPCCGTEFGVDDATRESVRRARDRWMKDGYGWIEEAKKPPGWQPELQLQKLQGTAFDPWA